MKRGTVREGEAVGLLVLAAFSLCWSAIGPSYRVTWLYEVAPAVLAVTALVATYWWHPFTPLFYRLALVLFVTMVVGAHYTYAEVPLGEWAQTTFELSRNNYDRAAHVVLGAVAAIGIREVLLLWSPLRPCVWLFLLVACACVSLSVMWELLEWGLTILNRESMEVGLDRQGDMWDTHWDILVALLGAVGAQALLARTHDRQLAAG